MREVRFMYDNPLGFQVKDSHKITRKKDILTCLMGIHNTIDYLNLRSKGYTRTLKSEYREWRAHNVLYRLGIARERTGSVDFDQNESKWRRFIYAILSVF